VLIRYRAEHDVSQSKLGKRLGGTQPRVAALESGERNPDYETTINAVDKLRVRVRHGFSPPSKKPEAPKLLTKAARRRMVIPWSAEVWLTHPSHLARQSGEVALLRRPCFRGRYDQRMCLVVDLRVANDTVPIVRTRCFSGEAREPPFGGEAGRGCLRVSWVREASLNVDGASCFASTQLKRCRGRSLASFPVVRQQHRAIRYSPEQSILSVDA
jgi:transcriptional regulator with XRE-family HTH domain